MDRAQSTPPHKCQIKCHNSVRNGSTSYKTPVLQKELKHKQTTYQNSTGGFTVLPSHITPPSGFTKFIARNPFESDLTSRLHLSVISPSVFNKIASPSSDSPGFTWSVEELALIQPARIEEFPVQQVHCTDPEVEQKAQAAINKFFDENQIIPSPWDERKKDDLKKMGMETPSRPLEDFNSTRESHKTKKESWTQTVLTLPVNLPEHVENILKPYLTFTQEQNTDTEEANSSNTSLRRKLFFNHNDDPEDEEDTSLSLSPAEPHGPVTSNCSPPQSGMLAHGSPLRHNLAQRLERTHGTPMAISGNFSPSSISPIDNVASEMSCQSIKFRSRSVARLDFTTDMSIDNSILEGKESKQSPASNTTEDDRASRLIRTEIDGFAKNPTEFVNLPNRDNTGQNDTVEMVLIPSELTPVKRIQKKEVFLASKNDYTANRLKLATEWCNVHSGESCSLQRSNIFSGASGQQSTFNFAQDTGYQTNSISYSMNVTDNYNVTPTKRQIHWDEQITLAEEEMHLSDWKKDTKHMFSSTPSRHSRERES